MDSIGIGTMLRISHYPFDMVVPDYSANTSSSFASICFPVCIESKAIWFGRIALDLKCDLSLISLGSLNDCVLISSSAGYDMLGVKDEGVIVKGQLVPRQPEVP